MLVLSRKPNETIRIGDHISIMVMRIGDNNVRLGIEAPRELPVHREEVYRTIETESSHIRSLAGVAVDGSETAAHYCETAIGLIDQVIAAKEFVGPLCRERLTMARDKLAAARAVLSETPQQQTEKR